MKKKLTLETRRNFWITKRIKKWNQPWKTFWRYFPRTITSLGFFHERCICLSIYLRQIKEKCTRPQKFGNGMIFVFPFFRMEIVSRRDIFLYRKRVDLYFCDWFTKYFLRQSIKIDIISACNQLSEPTKAQDFLKVSKQENFWQQMIYM